MKLESSCSNQQSLPQSDDSKKLSLQQEDKLKKKVEEDKHIKVCELQEVNDSVPKHTIQELFHDLHKHK